CLYLHAMSVSHVCSSTSFFFFFNDTATTEIYTLSLHDALPILPSKSAQPLSHSPPALSIPSASAPSTATTPSPLIPNCESPSSRSEEHTSELQSRFDLVCRLLLEKKKYTKHINQYTTTLKPTPT